MPVTPDPERRQGGSDRLTADPEGAARFRQNLLKVMGVQVVALLALWWLQSRYNG